MAASCLLETPTVEQCYSALACQTGGEVEEEEEQRGDEEADSQMCSYKGPTFAPEAVAGSRSCCYYC